jgi:DNA-binding response OmpR family regulator
VLLDLDQWNWTQDVVRTNSDTLERTSKISMRLLLVEDELDIQRFLKHSLAEAGYQVDAVGTAAAAVNAATECSYDLLVIDLGLPDKDGIRLILELRQIGVAAPVLILSARRSVDERVKGLEQGGDDYLTKPFSLAELLARLRNLLRRHSSSPNTSGRLCVLDLELDLLQREVTRSGASIRLTSQEFALLEFLCRNAGKVVTRSMILERVWGLNIEPKTNIVDVHMSRLRAKVDGVGRKPLICTLRGMGYVLRDT